MLKTVATEVETIVFAGADDRDLTKLAEYEAVGGYQALTKARAMTPADVTEELITSELRNTTKLSPSVIALGTWKSWMPSPLK